MERKTFKSFSEAAKYARSVNQGQGRQVKVERSGSVFIVHIQDENKERIAHRNSVFSGQSNSAPTESIAVQRPERPNPARTPRKHQTTTVAAEAISRIATTPKPVLHPAPNPAPKPTAPQQPPLTPSLSNDPFEAVLRTVRNNVTDIENRRDLTKEQKLSKIKTIACSTCAAIAVQPIPFADIYILTPVQGYFGARVAAIHGVPVSDGEATDNIKAVIALIGMGLIAQQFVIGIWKIVSGGLGGFVTIPLVYGLSYAVMEVIDAYYANKSKGVNLQKDQMEAIFRQAIKEGKNRGKQYEAKKKNEK